LVGYSKPPLRITRERHAVSIIKFDHIGLIVEDLDAALDHFRRLFDFDDSQMIYERDYADVDPDTGVTDIMHTALFPVGEVYLELIEPVSEGPMKAFLERTGGGVHHIGITSDDIRGEWKRHNGQRDALGVVEARPRVDKFDVSYWFLHPKKNQRVLWEVDTAWTKTSLSDMTPIEPTPEWTDDEVAAAEAVVKS
jgi:methylmalonyl-CoA/ethylmalonyl-CoA epimerase